MNVMRKQSIAFALYLTMAFFAGLIRANASFAEEDYEVSIGSSSWSSKQAYSHDISREAMENGQNGFVVSSSPDESYQINLSDKQLEDILAGSTVVVATEEGNKKVKIASKREKAAKSGW